MWDEDVALGVGDSGLERWWEGLLALGQEVIGTVLDFDGEVEVLLR